MADVVSSTDKIIFYMCDFVFYYIMIYEYIQPTTHLEFTGKFSFIDCWRVPQTLLISNKLVTN